MISHTDRTTTIRSLNDRLRTSFEGGQVLFTAGVHAKGVDFMAEAITALQAFDSFDGSNDPRGEHNFGIFSIGETRLIWKIDYYDRTLQGGSHDPANPNITERVLTLLLSHEW